jgi:hypothetical protein
MKAEAIWKQGRTSNLDRILNFFFTPSSFLLSPNSLSLSIYLYLSLTHSPVILRSYCFSNSFILNLTFSASLSLSLSHTHTHTHSLTHTRLKLPRLLMSCLSLSLVLSCSHKKFTVLTIKPLEPLSILHCCKPVILFTSTQVQWKWNAVLITAVESFIVYVSPVLRNNCKHKVKCHYERVRTSLTWQGVQNVKVGKWTK